MRSKHGTLPSTLPSVEQLNHSEAPTQHSCEHLAEVSMAKWHRLIHRCILIPHHKIYFFDAVAAMAFSDMSHMYHSTAVL